LKKELAGAGALLYFLSSFAELLISLNYVPGKFYLKKKKMIKNRSKSRRWRKRTQKDPVKTVLLYLGQMI